jgi:pyruvate formate lyase activating enzyme
MSQPATELNIGGLARLSTCDWPGELAATIFCQGCAWSCPYCHNPGLRPMQAAEQISWASVQDFLASRRGLLDAVIFSGGEPTIQPALLEAIQEVRGLGFRVGLHTAGMFPSRFAELLPVLDWVGFDVKAPFDSYAAITGAANSGEHAMKSLRSLLGSGVAYEVRTTCHPALLSLADMIAVKQTLLELGVVNFAVQRYRDHPEQSRELLAPPPIELPQDFAEGFARFEIR